MSIHKEFVPYTESLELKELGFDEPCLCSYTHNGQLIRYMNPDKDWNSVHSQTLKNSKITLPNTYSAPTFSQAFKFFREKYDLQCWSEPTGSDRYSCRYDGNDETGRRWVGYLRNNNKEILFHPTYEEAELACLRKLIEIVKQKS